MRGGTGGAVHEDGGVKITGFANFDEMLNFWAGRLPFRGHIIHWKTESTLIPSQVRTRKRVA